MNLSPSVRCPSAAHSACDEHAKLHGRGSDKAVERHGANAPFERSRFGKRKHALANLFARTLARTRVLWLGFEDLDTCDGLGDEPPLNDSVAIPPADSRIECATAID